MQTCLSNLLKPETSENYWVLYWYKVWQSQPFSYARNHLIAYLQESCYWAAKKVYLSLSFVQYSLCNCFQIAIAEVDKILQGFNPQQGKVLKYYAEVIFRSVIQNTLRQRHEVDICTPWALLRKISQKRLVESLQSSGLSSEVVASYVLAWRCFKTLYTPVGATPTRKLPSPDPVTWNAIAFLYNQESHRQINPSGVIVAAKTLEKWLLICASAARKYLYPTQTSLNAMMPELETGEVGANIAIEQQESLLNELIIQEEEQQRQSQQSQINTILVTAISKIESQGQQLLQMYYGKGLTQQTIAQQLQIKQYTVSRRLTSTRKTLLLTLSEWSQETLNITLTSAFLKEISTVVEEWLTMYYSNS
jgi:RNA polymerase sigma factor (sigma-70 family)